MEPVWTPSVTVMTAGEAKVALCQTKMNVNTGKLTLTSGGKVTVDTGTILPLANTLMCEFYQ